MWLIGELKNLGGWLISIGRKILGVALGSIAIVVLATLASQIFRMLAFLLPLKIVILIGSSGIPRYFPPFMLDYGRNNLVVGLGIATVVFFAAHIFSQRVVEHFTEQTADRVLAKSDKLTRFKNQDNVTRSACRRFAEAVAGGIFFGLVMIGIGLVHSSVAGLLALWVVVWFGIAAVGGAISPRFRTWLEDHGSAYVIAAGSTGIFAVTGQIILEFVSGVDLNILYAIISIILSRQAFSRGSKAVSNVLALYSNKLMINALFYRSHVWQDGVGGANRSVWNLLAPDEQQDWLPELLEHAQGRKVASAAITALHQTGIADILAVEAFARFTDESEGRFFVKLFGRGRQLDASHEAALLSACEHGQLPTPSHLITREVEDTTCLVYDGLIAEAPEDNQKKNLRMHAVAACWAVELPRDLADRFRRTHRLLHQRLGDADLSHLAFAAFDADQKRQVAALRDRIPHLCAWLSDRPQALLNPGLSRETLFLGPNDTPVATDWRSWCIEPIGAGWPMGEAELEQVGDWLSVAQAKRPALKKVSVSEAQFAALLYDFEQSVRKQQMREALLLLPAILAKAEEFCIGDKVPETARRLPEIPARRRSPKTIGTLASAAK